MNNTSTALTMIINHWGPEFTRLYGHIFPESYLALDCEYTGGNDKKDLITEIGHVLVEGRRVVDRLGLVLDWTNHSIVPDEWLRKTLRRQQVMATANNYKPRITYEVMQQEGVRPPEKVLRFYLDLFRTVKKRIGFFAAHNGYQADARMLRGAFEGFLGETFQFAGNCLFDTGGIEKATQCLESEDPQIRERRDVWLPCRGDTLESYFRRVCNAPAKGIFWRLPLCIEKYGLIEKHGLDMSQHHTVDFDALAVHYLMESYRERIVRNHSGENTLGSPESFARMFDEGIARSLEKREEQERAELAQAGILAQRKRRRKQRVL